MARLIVFACMVQPRPVHAGMSNVVPLGRQLQTTTTTISVNTVSGLTDAVHRSSVDRIVLAPGVYEMDASDVCDRDSQPSWHPSGSWLCVSRAMTIEAAVNGTVVLDAWKYGMRVFSVGSGGPLELIGLNITGGSRTVCALACTA